MSPILPVGEGRHLAVIRNPARQLRAKLVTAQAALLGLASIVLAGFAIRAYLVSERSLWFDEAFTWRLTEFSLGEMIRRITDDNSPPLYYLLLKLWTAVFGASALALRSLSVLCGTLTIVGMYLFAAEAFRGREYSSSGAGETNRPGRRLGLLVAALVAFSVFQIRWSWEARMYTLGTALLSFSTWSLFRALHASDHALGKWVLYGLFTLLFAYTHYYALFSIAAQAVFILACLMVRARGNIIQILRQTTFWHALVAADILAVGWLPWLPFFLKMRSQVQGDFWTQPPIWWDVPQLCYQMFIEPENAGLNRRHALWAAGLCGFGLLALLWKARAAEWYVFL